MRYGQTITDENVADMMMKGLPDECEYMCSRSCNQRDSGLEDV